MVIVPKKVFLTAGVGKHPTKLGSFERALRDAKIYPYNLVPVSSIIPPEAEIISREEGLKYLVPGQILFVVMSRISSDEVGRHIVAAIGGAKEKGKRLHGYLSEYSVFDTPVSIAKKTAEYLSAEMLITIRGGESWHPESEGPNLDHLDVFSIAAEAEVKEGDGWVTAIAAAVLLY